MIEGRLTELEKIYFDDTLDDVTKVYRMAEYLNDKKNIHQQLYFAIKDMYENERKVFL